MELRLLIYKEALTGNSGFLAFPYEYLSSPYRNHSLAISLLATCSDIYHSATPFIYTSNVFLIVVNTCFETYKLTIFPSTLPSHVLPRIEHAFVVLDARLEAYGYFPSEISEEDCYSNLREMTGLKSLGMTIVTKSHHTTLGNFAEKLGALIREVIKSVPKECELHIGKTSDAEKDFVRLFTAPSESRFYGSNGPFVEVAEETLISIGEKIDFDMQFPQRTSIRI